MLPQAVKDLASFTDYAQTLGATAPAHADVQQSFQVSGQWSAMRQASSNWDGYCVLQEGLSWKTMRAHMDSLRPAFDLAATANPQLVTKYPGLAAVLGAKKAIAQKAASTKRLNKEAIAKGEAPVHGAVGKKRQRKAEKAALASGAAATPPTSSTSAPQPTATAPAAVTVAPAATPVNGASNGAAR